MVCFDTSLLSSDFFSYLKKFFFSFYFILYIYFSFLFFKLFFLFEKNHLWTKQILQPNSLVVGIYFLYILKLCIVSKYILVLNIYCCFLTYCEDCYFMLSKILNTHVCCMVWRSDVLCNSCTNKCTLHFFFFHLSVK